jgi:hypothetical protein
MEAISGAWLNHTTKVRKKRLGRQMQYPHAAVERREPEAGRVHFDVSVLKKRNGADDHGCEPSRLTPLPWEPCNPSLDCVYACEWALRHCMRTRTAASPVPIANVLK